MLSFYTELFSTVFIKNYRALAIFPKIHFLLWSTYFFSLHHAIFNTILFYAFVCFELFWVSFLVFNLEKINNETVLWNLLNGDSAFFNIKDEFLNLMQFLLPLTTMNPTRSNYISIANNVWNCTLYFIDKNSHFNLTVFICQMIHQFFVFLFWRMDWSIFLYVMGYKC